MLYRNFAPGNSRWSALALGCSRVGSFNNATPISEIRRTLSVALDSGVTVFDTANIYGQGDSEREIGRLLARNANGAYIVTKVGQRFSMKMRLLRPLKPFIRPLLSRGRRLALSERRGAEMSVDFQPSAIVASAEASLRRLRRDRIDGLLLHSPPVEVVRDPAVIDALDRLRRDGKVQHYGVSCETLQEVSAAIGAPGLAILQIPVSVLRDRAFPDLFRPVADRIGLMVREAIKSRPDLKPAQAVAEIVRDPMVTTLVVGTSNPRHLKELIEGLSER